MKTIKIISVFSLLFFVFVYVGFYLNAKKNIEQDLPPSYEKEDNYIFTNYYFCNKRYPVNETQIRSFLLNKYTEYFVGNQMVEYLLKNDFHIKFDTKSNVYFVYVNGPNYKNDNLYKISDLSNFNFFNFLFIKGDILLFYTKKKNIADKNSQYFDDTMSGFGINLDSIR